MAMNGHEITSVVQQPSASTPVNLDSLVLYLATEADDVPRWGTDIRFRDRKLREIARNEDMLKGVMFGTCARYASFEWTLSGPARQVNIVHRVLNQCEHGRGWLAMMMPFVKDYLGQDNGAFLEVIRTEDSENAPVIQLNHLDAGRCQRTGRWDAPVIYTDIENNKHLLKWYQVIYHTEYPDPDEKMRGYQECAVSRLLRSMQKARDIAIYEHEKVSGRQHHQIHLIGGVPQQRIDNMVKLADSRSDNMGLMRYSAPVVIAAIDQTARVSHEEINLAGMPENYDKEIEMRWYVIALANAFGIDPQDVAPLQGGNLGSAQQSQVLAQKGRGKGPALFMRGIEHIFNFHGIIPRTVQFRYGKQDKTEDSEEIMLEWRFAQMAKLYIETKVLDPQTVRQILFDRGFLKREYLEIFGEEDLTPVIDRGSEDKT